MEISSNASSCYLRQTAYLEEHVENFPIFAGTIVGFSNQFLILFYVPQSHLPWLACPHHSFAHITDIPLCSQLQLSTRSLAQLILYLADLVSQAIRGIVGPFLLTLKMYYLIG